MPTIIYPPSIPWNWMFQRPQQLLRQLAACGYQVLYEDLGTFPAPKVQRLSSTFSLCQGLPALSVSHSRPRILWLSVPSHIGLIHEYDPDLVIFDAVDEPQEEFASWAPYFPAILRSADLILASAQSMYEALASQHPNVHLVPNGVDYAHFAAPGWPRPKDLPGGKPVIGYSGAIAPWVDWDLLRICVAANPQYQFVFVGTLFQITKFPLKSSNVSYLGLKPYARLPAYLQHFAAGLIPFRLTAMTKGCNPIKLYEYCAAGLPVMGTPLPELLAVPGINLESDPTLFARRLGEVVRNGASGRDERLAYARSNDWAIRAAKIHTIIATTMLGRSPAM